MPASARTFLLLLVVAGLAMLLLALMTGTGAAGPRTLADLLTGHADARELDVILRLRAPRALAAFACGASLAVAGALMQVLLRNPLADPYVLGTSGGAAVAALATMLLGGSGVIVDGMAFGGALISTIVVFALARGGGRTDAGRLLLTGVVVAAGWSAVVSLLLAISPDARLRGILFWLMGDFSFVEQPWVVMAVAAGGALAGIGLARTLNVLGTGDRQAALLGLEVGPVRAIIYSLAALLTSISVTTAGVVGFVGLIVPHFVRLAAGSDHRLVIPGSALAGGVLLLVADLLARTLLAPRQLPVGAIMAAVGVPAFLFLLAREAKPER